MIKKFKELDNIKKVLLIIIFITVILFLKIGLKIAVNYLFIKDYPEKDQEYRVQFISFINLYEPYISPYNYGNYLYQKGLYTEAYSKYLDSLSHNIPANRICKVQINAGLTLMKLSEFETDEEKAIELLERANNHFQVCRTVAGPGDAQGGGDNDGNNGGNNNDNGNQDKEIEGDQDNAKKLQDAIQQKKDQLGENKTKQNDGDGNHQSQTQQNNNNNSGSSSANASPKIENVEKESVKGTYKRDKVFQEQSYNNKGQYGEETPGSGCIGACW